MEHHPNEQWGFWDNILEHHPNFWNTTQSSRGDSGTTFWSTIPTFRTPPHRAVGILGQLFGAPPQHHPIGATTRTLTGQCGGSGASFWNTIPSSRRATNQTTRNTIYGEGSGATFGTSPLLAARPRPREWRLRVHFSMRADQVAARINHMCQLGQNGGSGPLFDGDTEPQQCLVLQPLLSPAVFFTLLSVAWVLPTMVVPTLTSLRSQFCASPENDVDIVSMSVLLSLHASFLFHKFSQPYWCQFTRVSGVS